MGSAKSQTPHSSQVGFQCICQQRAIGAPALEGDLLGAMPSWRRMAMDMRGPSVSSVRARCCRRTFTCTDTECTLKIWIKYILSFQRSAK